MTILEDIIRWHNEVENTYTKHGRPFILVTYFAFSDKERAINFDKYLKTGSGKVPLIYLRSGLF
jgi:putative endonuclease